MKTKLKTYYIQCTTEFGTGLACFKGSSEADAKRRFKKRYKKQIVIDAWEEPNPRSGMRIEY